MIEAIFRLLVVGAVIVVVIEVGFYLGGLLRSKLHSKEDIERYDMEMAIELGFRHDKPKCKIHDWSKIDGSGLKCFNCGKESGK